MHQINKSKKLITFVITILLALSLSGCDCGTTTPDDAVLDLIITESQDTVEINTTWVDAGAKFYIDDQSLTVAGVESVDATTIGLYEIEYSYAYEGAIYTKVRFVIVVNQTKPEILLNAGLDTIQVGVVWEDAGATVSDNSGETLTITVAGTVDINTAGEYEITYTAEDSSGNIQVKTRYVNVVE